MRLWSTVLWCHVGGPGWEAHLLSNKAWNNRLLHCPGLWWGLYQTLCKEHWSTFKCNRTSHSALQMLILASRYPTKPAFLTLAASKAAYVPRKTIEEEKPKEKRGNIEVNCWAFSPTKIITVQVTVKDTVLYCVLQLCLHTFLHLNGRTLCKYCTSL